MRHQPTLTATSAVAGIAAATPAAARALLAILLAPLFAALDAQLSKLLARLDDLMQQWRDGTLPAPPAIRPLPGRRESSPTAPRRQTAREPAWLGALLDLATQDTSLPRTRRARTATPAPQPLTQPDECAASNSPQPHCARRTRPFRRPTARPDRVRQPPKRPTLQNRPRGRHANARLFCYDIKTYSCQPHFPSSTRLPIVIRCTSDGPS